MKSIIKRMKKPTPAYFKKLRNVGIAIAGVSTAVLTAPVALPAIVLKIAGYLAVGSAVLTGVSQSAVKNETD